MYASIGSMMSRFRTWKNTSNLQIFETFHGLSATPDRNHELKSRLLYIGPSLITMIAPLKYDKVFRRLKKLPDYDRLPHYWKPISSLRQCGVSSLELFQVPF